MPRTFDADESRSTLFSGLIAAARHAGWNKVILEDAERNPLTFQRLILGSLVLGRKLAQLSKPGEYVGVLLPNSAGLTVTLFGLNAFGRVPALLNFSAGKKNLISAIHTGCLKTVITSRRFVEMGKLEELIEALAEAKTAIGENVRIVYLEDVRASVSTIDKAAGMLRTMLAHIANPQSPANANKPAVVLFTSGTEGAPKGVVLSNANLIANAHQMHDHMSEILGSDEVVFNPLPMFHSFGLTAATLTPLLEGIKVVLYPSPLHYRQIPKFIRRSKATILFGTDTFLAGYVRSAEPGDLSSLHYVFAGAERVKPQTRKLCAGTDTVVFEGYGATECSPVLACNQLKANHPGTVGRLLPGISARVEPVEGIPEGGRLYVRGPNVMAGYLLHDNPGQIVPPMGGWHDTGDIVTIDNDGFVTISGRAKRFAKIGGEMVSLAAVETLASSLWSDALHVAVSVPDPRKGEQLVLITDKPDAEKAALLAHARAEGFPELWVPKSVHVVDAVPVLGSGKVDFQAASELARQSGPQR